MKPTKETTQNLCQQMKELSKYELLMLKAGIVIFVTVLNICCVHLIF